jgi:HSP20 family protein
MPGLKHESVDVRVENGALRIAAESRRPEWPADARMHVAERSYGSVKRAFQLPEDAGHDQIHAAYKDGVLEVVIEKKVESRPVKIQVN